MNRAVKLTASLLLSAVFLYVAFRGVDFDVVLVELATVRLPYVALYVLSLFFIQVCRALRWDLLIRPFAKVSREALFQPVREAFTHDHDATAA